jgi:predicted DsbA family dithiol-disulfide isomerase
LSFQVGNGTLIIMAGCYIGKRRLEKAIACRGGPVEVRWLRFQLNPTMSKEGTSRREYRTNKFGRRERSQELDATVIAVGKVEGIDFAFDRVDRTPNTLDAHRLLVMAEQEDHQDPVVEALFRAYFIDGRDISNRCMLIDVVSEAGLNRQRAGVMLKRDEGMDAIKELGELSQRHHVAGVPFFIVNGQLTLSGAQQADTFLEAFRQAVGST